MRSSNAVHVLDHKALNVFLRAQLLSLHVNVAFKFVFVLLLLAFKTYILRISPRMGRACLLAFGFGQSVKPLGLLSFVAEANRELNFVGFTRGVGWGLDPDLVLRCFGVSHGNFVEGATLQRNDCLADYIFVKLMWRSFLVAVKRVISQHEHTTSPHFVRWWILPCLDNLLVCAHLLLQSEAAF